jgi:hypothetical protein
LVLIAVSVREVFKMLIGISHEMANTKDTLLMGTLAAALVPSTMMIIWACRAFAADADLLLKKVRRFVRR